MVRSYLGASGAVASAGIVALVLVVVTPSEAHAASIDMRAVRVTSIAFPSAPATTAAELPATPPDPVAFLRMEDYFGALAGDERFVAAYTAHLASLREKGARATLEAFMRGA